MSLEDIQVVIVDDETFDARVDTVIPTAGDTSDGRPHRKLHILLPSSFNSEAIDASMLTLRTVKFHSSALVVCRKESGTRAARTASAPFQPWAPFMI